jgi:hypothetical protein
MCPYQRTDAPKLLQPLGVRMRLGDRRYLAIESTHPLVQVE